MSSTKKQYFFAVMASLINLISSALSGLVLPKALGAFYFGKLSFLLNSISAIKTFTGFGADIAFMTYNSKRSKSDIVIALYSGWLFLQLIVVLSIVTFFYLLDISHKMWPEQELHYIYIFAILDFIVSYGMNLVQFGHSKSLTKMVVIIDTILKLSRTLLIVILYYAEELDFDSYIVLLYFLNLSLNFVLLVYYWRVRLNILDKLDFSSDKVKNIINYFVTFCKPLVIYNFCAAISSFLQIWLLQNLYGSVQQGYYSLGLQFSQLMIAFGGAVLPIFWRRMAQEGVSKEEKTSFFMKNITALLGINSILVFLYIFNVQNVIKVWYGPDYADAVATMIIIGFLPIFRSMTQFCTTFFYANNMTELHKNISISQNVTALVCAYILLAPYEYFIPGLQLGSTGLALNMAIVPLFFANFRLYYVCKSLSASYRALIIFQLFCLIICAVVSLIIYNATGLIVSKFNLPSVYLEMMIFSFIYLLSMLLIASKILRKFFYMRLHA